MSLGQCDAPSTGTFADGPPYVVTGDGVGPNLGDEADGGPRPDDARSDRRRPAECWSADLRAVFSPPSPVGRRGVSVAVEDYEDFEHEFMEMAEQHFAEVAAAEGHPYDPDFSMYRNAEKAGALGSFVFRADGEFAGYLLFTLSSPAESKSSITAYEAGMYLTPPARNFRVVNSALDAVFDAITRTGVGRVIMSTRSRGDPRLKNLLERRGFRVYLIEHELILG